MMHIFPHTVNKYAKYVAAERVAAGIDTSNYVFPLTFLMYFLGYYIMIAIDKLGFTDEKKVETEQASQKD